jgi:hypothetical protein
MPWSNPARPGCPARTHSTCRGDSTCEDLVVGIRQGQPCFILTPWWKAGTCSWGEDGGWVLSSIINLLTLPERGWKISETTKKNVIFRSMLIYQRVTISKVVGFEQGSKPAQESFHCVEIPGFPNHGWWILIIANKTQGVWPPVISNQKGFWSLLT